MLAFARGERWEIYVAAALLGSGIGLAFAAMPNLIIENVGAAQTGVATGMNTVTRTVGGGFGGAATASLLAGTVGLSGYPSAHGYTAAFALCAVALAVGVVVGLAIPQRRPEAAFGPHPSAIPSSRRPEKSAGILGAWPRTTRRSHAETCSSASAGSSGVPCSSSPSSPRSSSRRIATQRLSRLRSR